MRERRWITPSPLSFDEILRLCGRLADRGTRTASPGSEIIVYAEDWTVTNPGEIRRLAAWPLEDVTLLQIHEEWRGDFYLLAGGYHSVYRQHKGSGTYCSISHPWKIGADLRKHSPRAMFWVGFRNRFYSFIRVRLETVSVITPGETREEADRDEWLRERALAFQSAVDRLELPLEIHNNGRLVAPQSPDPTKPLLCSWPDAFGPCQFEYNSPDPYEFLVPAARLAETSADRPVTVRAYLNGFEESALAEFHAVAPVSRRAYRLSAHVILEDIPEILDAVLPDGRVYTSLSEFQIDGERSEGPAPWAVIGAAGDREGFRVEVRLNRAPHEEDRMAGWIETIIGMPVEYAPLPAFP